MTLLVEHLSKKYSVLRNQKLETETLKDKLTAGLKRVFSPKKIIKNAPHEFWALNDVSFSLDPGDKLAVIGKNGAGKSTLLKIISRITPPTNGKITVRGKVAALLEVGTGFHPELTGKENIYLSGALLGMSKIEIAGKFDEIVDFSEIELFLDTPVKRYSSGMFVRLAFAVAAHLEAEILIIDEALAVGDTQYKKKCIDKLEEVGKEGRTIIFVTHDMWALRFCNKGLLLENGSVVPTDSLADCVAKYSGSGSPQKGSSWSGKFENGPVVIHSLEYTPPKSPLGKGSVSIKISLLQAIPDLFVGFLIVNRSGNIIVRHKITGESGSEIKFLQGSYEFLSEIDPGMFLNGIYTIELDILLPEGKKISHQGIAVSFEIFRPENSGNLQDTLLTGWKGDFKSIPCMI